MQFTKNSDILPTTICESKKSISCPSHPYYGIYSRDPFEVAKTIARPRAPTFNKREPPQWKIQVTANQKWEENQHSQNNVVDQSLAPESPVITNRYTLNYKSANHRIVSLF